MGNEYKKHAGEFKNPSKVEEELDEEGFDFIIEEAEFFKDDFSFTNNENNPKRDEDRFLELIEEGVDEIEAAHIVNREREKKLRYERL